MAIHRTFSSLACALLLSCANPAPPPVHSHTLDEVRGTASAGIRYTRERDWLDTLESDLLGIEPTAGRLSVSAREGGFSMTIPGKFIHGRNELVDGTARHYVCTLEHGEGFGLHREVRDRSGQVVSDNLLLTGVKAVEIFLPVADETWVSADGDRFFGRSDAPMPKSLRVDLTTLSSTNERQLVRKVMWIP